MTHICISKLTIIGSDNGLSPGRCQAIIWTNARILLIRTLGTNSSEILSAIGTFSFKKMHLKMLSAKWHLFRLGLNEVINENEILTLESCHSANFVVTCGTGGCQNDKHLYHKGDKSGLMKTLLFSGSDLFGVISALSICNILACLLCYKTTWHY